MADTWLLADLGGTNTRVGQAIGGDLSGPSLRSYPNASFDSFQEVLQRYIEDTRPGPIAALCTGVAGPVRDGTAQLTNHDWFVDSSALASGIGAKRVFLLNDLQAQGYGLADISPQHVTSIVTGAQPPPQATRMVMGLGTGCNIAVVYDTSSGLLVPAAEAGHTSLPYGSGSQGDLVAWLGTLASHRPIESALSGPGLSNIYQWRSGQSLPPRDILALYQDAAPEASDAVNMFCNILGQVAGDLCLAHLPMGGLYFIGGLARAIAPILSGTDFHDKFCAKGPYADIMRAIPIRLITDDMAALRGCSRYLIQTL